MSHLMAINLLPSDIFTKQSWKYELFNKALNCRQHNVLINQFYYRFSTETDEYGNVEDNFLHRNNRSDSIPNLNSS